MNGRTTSAFARRSTRLSCPTKLELSPQQRDLVNLLYRIRFGRILCLDIRDGQPSLRDVRWTQKVKVLGDQAPHPSIHQTHPELPDELSELFKQFLRLGHGQVVNLEIRNGVPFSYELNGAS